MTTLRNSIKQSKMAEKPQMPPSLKKAFEDTKVTYTQLGKSGLRVSIPILGMLLAATLSTEDTLTT